MMMLGLFNPSNVPFVGKVVIENGKHRYLWKLRAELKEALEEMDLMQIDRKVQKTTAFDHNLILYGPPGTGKTYNSAIYAVAICDSLDIDDVKKMPYQDVLDRYDNLKKEGRIAFTTFHQSYGYEEFIEGIKPRLDENDSIGYSVEDGVFKKFCNKAGGFKILGTMRATGKVWSVRNRAKDDDVPFDLNAYQYDEGAIVVESLTDINRQCDRLAKMERGDLIVLGRDSIVEAIGVITDDAPAQIEKDPFHWKRSVNWLEKGLSIKIADLGAAVTVFSNFAIAESKVSAKALQTYLSGENDDPNEIVGHKFTVSDSAKVWKVTVRPEVKQDCFNNDRVRINWGIDGDGAKGFVNDICVGDLIVTTDGSRSSITGIAVVKDDDAYSIDAESDTTARDVQWLAKNLNEDIVSINGGKLIGRRTVARVPGMSVVGLMDIAVRHNSELQNAKIENNKQPYVFIIDEINRGNMSKIFGELITLVEDTKRAGASESMDAILPYSGESFSVPDNIYILGTMNTADRSIALMDTALRRRFRFVEMMPDSNVLDNLGVGTIAVGDEELNVARMLDVINQRIGYLFDREHTIGHAFFTKLAKDPSIDTLAEIFSKNVIPLLQEYFYEDYEKIQLVLGDNDKPDEFKFVLDRSIRIKDIFNGNPDIDLPEKSYVIQKDAFTKLQSYKLIGKDL